MKIVKNILFVILCLVLFVVVAAVSFLISANRFVQKRYDPIRVDWDDSVGTAYKNLTYGEEKYQTYDLYVPANLDNGKNYSLILFIYGGGVSGGDKSEGEILGKYFVSKGYLCASINYTILTEETPSNVKVVYQETRDAVDAVYQRAGELGCNITEIAVTGVSAGGCLALMYAYNPPEDAPIPVKFVFEQVGPVSFEPSGWGCGTAEECASFATLMTGQTITAEMMENGTYKQYIDEISPVAYVDKNTVPSILAYGVRDSAVPPPLKYMLIETLKENSVTHDYIEFPNSGHGLLNDPDKTVEYVEKVTEYLERYFENN